MDAATKGLLHDVRKKDDDAQTLFNVEDGQYYLETAIEVPGLDVVVSEEEGAATTNMFAESASAPNTDVHVLVVRRVFAAHGCFVLATMLLALPFYMWSTPLNHTAVVVTMCVASCAVFPLSYGLMLWFTSTKQHLYYTCAALVVWWTSCTVMVTCTAVLVRDTIPFQLAIVIWAQCIAMLVYTSASPRGIYAAHAALYMALAAMLAWGASIALSVSTHDWPGTIAVVCVALACVPYHAYQVRAAEGRYHAGWDDAVYATVAMYGMPVQRLAQQ